MKKLIGSLLISSTITFLSGFMFAANAMPVCQPYPQCLQGPPHVPVITSLQQVSANANEPFSYTITATNNPTFYSWTCQAPGNPYGFVLNPVTGKITGLPTNPPIWMSCTISATNSSGTGSAPLAIWVFFVHTAPGLTDCYSCHFQSFQNPKPTAASNHVANHFSTTGAACVGCHPAAAGVLTGTPLSASLWVTTMNHAVVGGTSAACQTCHMTDYANATTPIDHDMKNGGKFALPTACGNCHSYQSAWATSLIVPHPSGRCSSVPGSSTPWTHQNVTSCSDCHNSVVSMTQADGLFECGNCHSGMHRGTVPGVCAN
jgi:hypothetical protein